MYRVCGRVFSHEARSLHECLASIREMLCSKPYTCSSSGTGQLWEIASRKTCLIAVGPPGMKTLQAAMPSILEATYTASVEIACGTPSDVVETAGQLASTVRRKCSHVGIVLEPCSQG